MINDTDTIFTTSRRDLEQLVQVHGLRRITLALAEIADAEAGRLDRAQPRDDSAALAMRRNSGILSSIAATLYG